MRQFAPSASSLLKAAAVLREGNSAGKRTLPTAAPPTTPGSLTALIRLLIGN